MSSSSSHPTQFTSPTTDLRDKLTRKRSDSRSRSRSPDARYKSSSVCSHRRNRSPARLCSRQVSSTRRSPSLRARSPQFRTPYSSRRKSGDDGHRVRIEKSLSKSDHGRSSSKYSREKSSSSSYSLPREKSSRLTAERSVSRISSSEKRNHKDSSHVSSRHYSSHSRGVLESSPEPQASTSSTVVAAGADILPHARSKNKEGYKRKYRKLEG